MMTNRLSTKKLTTMGLLVAVSVLLVLVTRIPFPAAPFLEYDSADVAILLGTILYGTGPGLVITVLASAIQATTVSAGSGLYGFLMHVVATSAMVLVVGMFRGKGFSSTKQLVLALVLGSIAMTLVMVVANLFITPLFMGVPREQVVTMLLPIFVPFNLIKAVLNSVITFILYKSIGRFLQDGR